MPASIRNLFWLIPLGFGLAACGSPDQSAPQVDSATTDAPAVVEPSPDIDALLATADVKRGETLYFQCRACHTLEEGGAHKVGPKPVGAVRQTGRQRAGI